MTDADSVLRTFLVDGRLRAMPRAGRKRQIVLEYVVTAFEPGARYTELEVNAILRALMAEAPAPGALRADVAALRRYLVDAQLLERGDGMYWRIGGAVDVG